MAAPYQGTAKRFKPTPNYQSQAFLTRRRSSLPVETKYFDVSVSQVIASAADWTGTEVPATNYVQSDGTTVGAYTDSALIPSAVGAGYGQVTGNKYYLKKIRVRGCIIATAAADQADGLVGRTVRLVLVHDTQPNGAQAQGEEVFNDMGVASQCNYAFLAMGAGAGGRFRILDDTTVKVQPGTAQTDGANTGSVAFKTAEFNFSYKPRSPIQIVLKANSATPTVASLSNNNIFLLAHSGSATGPVLTLFGCSRCYYCD